MNIRDYMTNVGKQSVKASKEIKSLSTIDKNNLLLSIAESIRDEKDKIISANQEDINLAKKNNTSKVMINRLMLDNERIENIAKSVEDIVKLSDPVGRVLYETERPNGLIINRVSVPLGVIGIIYESRPNVTVDASVLCIKAGNVAILRGGSESFNSNTSLIKAIQLAAVDNLKRVILLKNKDLYNQEIENPYLITNFMETKTTWHPVEKISSAGSGY